MDRSTHKGYERQRPVAVVVAEVPAVTEVLLMVREWLHDITAPEGVALLAGVSAQDMAEFLIELERLADDIAEAGAIICDALGIDPLED